ncbi:MAG: hypothetical protein HY540_00490 [Deltaproteobacteria bacterium]|nr:hypothetical protein [Deltaproteobacteria bacterium]
MMILFPMIASAATSPSKLETLRRLRVKQQQEEGTIRVVSNVNVVKQEICDPAQQARQRVRDLPERSEQAEQKNVTINAGHERLDVTDNHGTINSDVNIQVIQQARERECL